LEILVAVVIRVVIGVFLSGALSFLGWFIARMVLPYFQFNVVNLGLVTVPTIGGLAALGAVLAWWNWETPRKVIALSALLIALAGMVSAAIAFQMALQTQSFTWLQRGIIFPMINAAVVGANLIGGAVFTYRAAFRREL